MGKILFVMFVFLPCVVSAGDNTTFTDVCTIEDKKKVFDQTTAHGNGGVLTPVIRNENDYSG